MICHMLCELWLFSVVVGPWAAQMAEVIFLSSWQTVTLFSKAALRLIFVKMPAPSRGPETFGDQQVQHHEHP